MDKKTLFENFQNNWMRLLSPFEIEDIEKWIDEDHMPVEVVNEALKETVIYNAKNTRYLSTVLNRWKNNQIDTLEKIEFSRLEFENKRLSKANSNSSNVPNWSNPDYKDPSLREFALQGIGEREDDSDADF
ncbi:DNA replication protein dnaD [Streptococcus porcinus]|uniref:DnaD domain-containing protein n=1 Tax=Streptococcus porcinus TaxID=1340 RepID=UPI0010CAD2A1|nr:DnaD domain protein [Streptococcus porcinus]VTS33157.1 DNA replication protein dnaD [Streptococcus porcinus]